MNPGVRKHRLKNKVLKTKRSKEAVEGCRLPKQTDGFSSWTHRQAHAAQIGPLFGLRLFNFPVANSSASAGELFGSCRRRHGPDPRICVPCIRKRVVLVVVLVVPKELVLLGVRKNKLSKEGKRQARTCHATQASRDQADREPPVAW